MIDEKELPFLKHTSYINTAQPVTFPLNDINKARKMGIITDSIRTKIIGTIESCRTLSPKQIKMIKERLRSKSNN